MAEAGKLHENARIELVDGELVEMSAKGVQGTCVNRSDRLVVWKVGDDVIVSIQSQVRLNEYPEPQPDVALIRTRDYRESPSTPEGVLLSIEVSDNTLAHDRGPKPSRYARAGIPEQRIVDLQGETLGSAALPGLEIRVDDVLGLRVPV